MGTYRWIPSRSIRYIDEVRDLNIYFEMYLTHILQQ